MILATALAAPGAATPASGFDADNFPLEGVVVTARKVQEDPQDVPMSIQVLSGEFLDSSDLTRLYELQFNVPGLVVNSFGMFGAGISLRGISDQGLGQSVATYLNGVYQGSTNLAVARLFDLERVEVLKGPQGTLYGRNATGGSISFITRPAEEVFSADFEAAYGSFETARMQGHVNVPYESSALRLSFIASEGDGYIRNTVDDRTFAESDYWAVRASYRLELSDALRIDVMAQHVRDDGASGELWGKRTDFLPDPSDIRLTTVTLADPHLDSEADSLSVHLDYDLGPATLRSITGYARSEVDDLDDCAGFPALQGCVRSVDPLDYEQWSQEVQLVFGGFSRVSGIVGAYYLEGDSSNDLYLIAPVLNPAPLTDSHETENETAAAVFGQGTWRLDDHWSLTAGLRFSHEERRFTTVGTGEDGPALQADEIDSHDTSWQLDVEYAATDAALVYAGISTGFKSGGFIATPGGTLDGFDPEHLVAYEAGGKSRWLDGRLILNGAIFYYDFDDLQVETVTITDDGELVEEVDNAARAEIYGVDAVAVFQASRTWSLSAGVVWLPKREFVEYESEVTDNDLSGNDLARAPEWSTIAAIEGEWPVRDLGILWGRLEHGFRSSHFFTKENDPIFAQGSYGLLNLYLGLDSASARWYAFASGRNLTDEDYFNQVFLQTSPGYPRTWEVGFGYRF